MKNELHLIALATKDFFSNKKHTGNLENGDKKQTNKQARKCETRHAASTFKY